MHSGRGAAGEPSSLPEPSWRSRRGRNGSWAETPAGIPRLRCSKPGMCPQPAPLGWLAAAPLPRPSGEAGFPLLLLLLLLRLLHLPLRRMPRYPALVPAHGLPSASRGAAGRESHAALGRAAGAASPRAAQPRIRGSGPQPTCRSARPGRAGLGRAGLPLAPRQRGKRGARGEAVPSSDTACGLRRCPSPLPGEPRSAAAGGPGGPAKGGGQPSTCGERLAPVGRLRMGGVQIWVRGVWGVCRDAHGCRLSRAGQSLWGLQTLDLWGACMGSVEECGYGLAWDVNEMHMGDPCVCSGGTA